MWKIEGPWELMNHAILTCVWLYDNDKLMNNSWIGDWYMHDTLIN